MFSRETLLSLAILAGLMVNSATAAQRTTLWITLDTERIGPAVACDGEFRIAGGKVVVSPWLEEAGDSVDGSAFKLCSEHDADSAKAARLQVVRRCTLPKGLLVEVIGPSQGTLTADTKLGTLEIDLAQIRQRRSMDLLGGKLHVQCIPNSTRFTGDQAEEEYPSLAVMPDGRPAVAYVAWDGKRDRVMVRIGEQARAIDAPPGDCMEPRCAVDGQGRLWVIWAASQKGQWDLWAQCDGRTMQLTRGRFNAFWPRLARDAKGRLWLAWQTADEGQHYEVFLARLGDKGLEGVTNVSQHAADDWEPAVCAMPDGRVAVAWDSYRNGSYDIYLREFSAEGQPLGPARPIAASPRREAHATLAADSANRLWIAWDVGNEDWGKHPEPRATLHSWRRSELACLADGKLLRPAADLATVAPQAIAKAKPTGKKPARKVDWDPESPGRSGGFIEYPQVAVDGQDRVWVIFRMENQVLPYWKSDKARRQQNYGMWHLMATCLEGNAWSKPMLLAHSSGRQDMRVDVAQDAQGQLLAVYGADGRVRQFPYVPVDYDVYLASLAGVGGSPRAPQLVEAPELGRIAPVKPDPELDPLPREWNIGGNRYRMVLGDTHRHTDISRCANGYDGSLQDAYRYALNACGLDWLAISDHDQDILKHRNDKQQRPRQDYDWWRSQKYCDLYTIPGRFVAVYGYEHGGSYQARGGHKNVVEAQRGQPVEEIDAPHELFAALADSGAIAIPHQLADGGSRMDWDKWSEPYERVAEIFQTRGSYEFAGCPRSAEIFTEGNSVWDALAKGVRIGIIASSDHGQTHQARAGVFVEADDGPLGFSREGILAGLRARRAFGATVAVLLRAQIGDRPMGQEIVTAAAPKIEAQVTAPAAIQRLDVVRDGRFVYSSQPGAKQAAFEFQDLNLEPGQSVYYYVRAQIGENDYAWSSPLWVTRQK